MLRSSATCCLPSRTNTSTPIARFQEVLAALARQAGKLIEEVERRLKLCDMNLQPGAQFHELAGKNIGSTAEEITRALLTGSNGRLLRG
jgi:hypothetical protein